jgi:hypothetical protein
MSSELMSELFFRIKLLRNATSFTISQDVLNLSFFLWYSVIILEIASIIIQCNRRNSFPIKNTVEHVCYNITQTAAETKKHADCSTVMYNCRGVCVT